MSRNSPSIITINGKPGAGKTTVAEKLAARLHTHVLDIGKLRRQEARRRNMTLAAFNTWSEQHPKAGDRSFDTALVQAARKQKRVVITSRMAFHFLPESFKVFLDVSPRVGAQRALTDKHDRVIEVGVRPTVAHIQRLHQQRMRSDTRRYRKLYGVNIFRLTSYDYVLNTTHIPIPIMVSKVAKAFRSWQKEQEKKKG